MNWLQKIYYRFRPEYQVIVDVKGNWYYHEDCVNWLQKNYGAKGEGWWSYHNHFKVVDVIGIVEKSNNVTYTFKRKKDALAFKLKWT